MYSDKIAHVLLSYPRYSSLFTMHGQTKQELKFYRGRHYKYIFGDMQAMYCIYRQVIFILTNLTIEMLHEYTLINAVLLQLRQENVMKVIRPVKLKWSTIDCNKNNSRCSCVYIPFITYIYFWGSSTTFSETLH